VVKKILIADDDLDNRTIAQTILEAAGHQVSLATNGLEVLDMVSKEKPDLILLDLSMPKLNGWETAKRLRQMSHMTGVPVLAFTAHALAGEALKAKVAGCDDYISKPCIPSEMAKKIEAWLDKPDSQRVHFGGERL